MAAKVESQAAAKLQAQDNTQERESKQKTYDVAQTTAIFTQLRKAEKDKKDADVAKEQQLAAVAVQAADVTIVAQQLNVTDAAAKRLLQKHNGNLEAALLA